MRLFLTLCTLTAMAYGKPQGYNYATGVSGGLGQLSSGGGSSGFLSSPSLGGLAGLGNVQSTGGFRGFNTAGNGGFSSGSGYSSGSSNGGSYSSGNGLGGVGSSSFSNGLGLSGSFSSSGINYQQQQQQQQSSAAFQAPIVHKQFITIAAPEDHENLEQSKHLVIGRAQKNYRVVFIKAPSSSSANVKLSAEYAPQEEKTVIYVLSKKDSSLEVNDIATPAPTVPSKPEVFFIKYKTDEEAQHAQRQIQAEYDRIEGTSEHTDGGVAPQQSVVGILDGGANGGIAAGSGSGSGSELGIGLSGSSSGSASFLGAASGNNQQGNKYLPPGQI